MWLARIPAYERLRDGQVSAVGICRLVGMTARSHPNADHPICAHGRRYHHAHLAAQSGGYLKSIWKKPWS